MKAIFLLIGIHSIATAAYIFSGLQLREASFVEGILPLILGAIFIRAYLQLRKGGDLSM
jgi:hypothetical protein